MARYNCSSNAEYLRMLKEDIMQAVDGRVRSDIDEGGRWTFEKASEKECRKVISDSVDEIAYSAIYSNAGSVAIEKVSGFTADSNMKMLAFGNVLTMEFSKWWALYKGESELYPDKCEEEEEEDDEASD